MTNKERQEIGVLVAALDARTYRCGMAAHHAIKDLWAENADLRARLAALLAENEQGAKELSGLKRKVDDVEGMAKRFNLTIAFTENLCKWLKEGK